MARGGTVDFEVRAHGLTRIRREAELARVALRRLRAERALRVGSFGDVEYQSSAPVVPTGSWHDEALDALLEPDAEVVVSSPSAEQRAGDYEALCRRAYERRLDVRRRPGLWELRVGTGRLRVMTRGSSLSGAGVTARFDRSRA